MGVDAPEPPLAVAAARGAHCGGVALDGGGGGGGDRFSGDIGDCASTKSSSSEPPVAIAGAAASGVPAGSDGADRERTMRGDPPDGVVASVDEDAVDARGASAEGGRTARGSATGIRGTGGDGATASRGLLPPRVGAGAPSATRDAPHGGSVMSTSSADAGARTESTDAVSAEALAAAAAGAVRRAGEFDAAAHAGLVGDAAGWLAAAACGCSSRLGSTGVSTQGGSWARV